MRAADCAGHFQDLTDEEAERLLRIIRYHESFFDFSLIGTLFGAPIKSVPEYSNERIGGFLALKVGDYALADRLFSKMIAGGMYAEDHCWLMCMKDYAFMRSKGLTHDQAAAVIRSTYKPEAAERAVRDTSDISAAIARELPKLPCPDCGSCVYRDNGCEYETRLDIYTKISGSMKKENVSQEALLKHLKELY